MKSCNILLENLPDTIICGGSSFRVRTDFKSWIKFGEALSGAMRAKSDKGFAPQLFEAVSCVLDLSGTVRLSGNITELISALFDFYRCGDEEQTKSNKKSAGSRSRAIYDFYEDADYIFASFLQIYGIDLTSCDMHWYKFLALFKSLPEDCKFSKIMSYRSCDTSKMKGEEKKFYTEMKQYYALSDNRTREEKDADLYAEISAII